jgi:hypothetical protein
VNGEENVEHHIGRNHGLIEDNASHLGVASGTRAHSLVARILDVAAHVANLNIDDSFELHVGAIETPKAAAT